MPSKAKKQAQRQRAIEQFMCGWCGQPLAPFEQARKVNLTMLIAPGVPGTTVVQRTMHSQCVLLAEQQGRIVWTAA